MDSISQFGSLDKQQMGLLLEKAKESTLNKGAYFSEAGKIARQVGFLSAGVIRFFYHDDNGQEVTFPLPSRLAQDDTLREELWSQSEQLLADAKFKLA